MEIVEAKIGKLMALLAAGKADIILEIEPMVSLAEQQGLRVVLSMGDFFPSLLFTGIMASLATIESHPEIVERFVLGIQRGLNICHREPERLLGVAKDLFPAISDKCLSQAISRMLYDCAWA